MELFNNTHKTALVVEYNGSKYYGFQWQKDLPTIQAELEKALHSVTGERKRIMAASRTDTGVHATGQVAGFRTRSELPAQTLLKALNYYLPGDIAVKAACRTGDELNIRRDAISREYEYKIYNSETRSPLKEGFSYRVPVKLNIELMKRACRMLEGEHDLASFASDLDMGISTVRTVYRAEVSGAGNMVIFHIIGRSFLTHQVRNTVGLLVRTGLGKVSLDEFREIMEVRKPGTAGPAAPPYGLYLTKVNYPQDVELKYEDLFNKG